MVNLKYQDRVVCTDPRAESTLTPDKGLGLFATEAIKAGENVFEITACFASVLNRERLADTCSNCFSSVDEDVNPVNLSVCSGCRVVKYCGMRCQAESWASSHKKECKIYKKLHPNILPTNSRAVARMMLEPDNFTYKSMHQQHVEAMGTLSHHLKGMNERDDGQIDRVCISGEGLKAILESPRSRDEFTLQFAKLETNAFTLTNRYSEPIGLCIIPFASYINHSCDPNAYIGFDGPLMYLKTLRDVKHGEQIYISYIDNTYPYERRQEELDTRYFFTCKCPKCLKGDKAREDKFLRGTDKDDGIELAYRQVDMLLAHSSQPQETPASSIRRTESAIACLQKTGKWPITRQPYPRLVDDSIVGYLDSKQYKSAFIFATLRYLQIDPIVYPNQLHPIRRRNTYALAKLALLFSQSVEAPEGDATVDKSHQKLEKYDLHYALIYYSLLRELIETAGPAFLSLTAMFSRNFNDVKIEFAKNGMIPENMKKEIDEEWKKMAKIADSEPRKFSTYYDEYSVEDYL
ncbi:hypothetical protein FQN55_003007 [Onygenales sp. PD_40]|nr:hypothetical protein FQN55_003007 [Onygenales sp. PD_40]KAK2784672.1 hypothetical protein FQN52_008900 [Onygenales sp. PD_12]